MSEIALAGVTVNGRFELTIALGDWLYRDADADETSIDMVEATIALRVGNEGDYRARQPAMVMGRELASWLCDLSAFAAGGGSDGELTLTNVEQGFELTVARVDDRDQPYHGRGFVQQSYGARLIFWEVGFVAADLAALRRDLRAATTAYPARGAQVR